MGQNASHERGAKHRQSTRSLPDATLHRVENTDAQRWAAYANGSVGVKKNHFTTTKENAGVLCAKNTNNNNNHASACYEQNAENFQRNWSKAAAPYYAPSDASGKKPPISARSYDGNYRNAERGHVESDRLERKGPFPHDSANNDDNWSDVASDMYRLHRHQGLVRGGSSSTYSSQRHDMARHYEENIREEESKSDFAAPSTKQHKSSRKYRRGGSEVNVPLSRVPENSSSDHHAIVDESRNRYSSNRYSTRSSNAAPSGVGNGANDHVQKPHYHYDHVTGHQPEFLESAKSSSKRSKSVQDFRRPTRAPPVGGNNTSDAVAGPVRPPKNAHYYARLENPTEEKWIDSPPRNSKVKFDSSSGVATSSPSSNFSSPKSPTSSECEKLIIQSLKAELAAERLKRVDLERKSKKDHIELDTLKRTVVALENQVQLLTSSLHETERTQPRLDKTTTELKEVCTQLTSHIKQLEDEKNRLTLDGQQQKVAYERCLTDAAESVARAVISDKALKSECLKLQKHVFDLEWKNKILSSQVETLSNSVQPIQRFTNLVHPQQQQQMFNHRYQEPTTSSTPTYSNKWSPAASVMNQSKCSSTLPVFPPMIANVSAASVESITSFNEQNMLVADSAVVTTSPMSNGGEALCSRPTSFNFDTVYAYGSLQHQQQLKQQKQDSDSDLYSECSNSEIPRNFAALYGEIDDPYQNSMRNKTRREHPLLNVTTLSNNSAFGQQLQQHQNEILPSSGISPVKRLKTPSFSDDAAGSNETLCPTVEQPQPQPQTPKQPQREIVVNIVRTGNLNPDIFRRSVFLPKVKPLSGCLMEKKFSPADDGYSTMSSCNYYVFEALLSSKMNFVAKPYSDSAILNANKFHQSCCNNMKRVLSDQTIIVDRFKRSLSKPFGLHKSYSDSNLYIKTKKELMLFDRELYDLLSSRNDLTEFERDLLEDEFKQQREGLFELNDEIKSDLLKQDLDRTTTPSATEKSPTVAAETVLCKSDNVQQQSCLNKIVQERNVPLAARAPPPPPPRRCSSPKRPTTTPAVAQQKFPATCRPTGKNKKMAPLRQELNDSSTTSSYTSEDDSEDDGTSTVKEWLKQLKIRKAHGKMAVVRYLPPGQRPSVLRRDVFYRFGKHERKALTSFDFLYRSCNPSDDGSKPSDAKVFARRRVLSSNNDNNAIRRLQSIDKRKSGSFSDVCYAAGTTTTNFTTSDDYENLPYHRLARTLSADDLQVRGDLLQKPSRHDLSSSASSSLDERSGSYGSSLFLSDLCVADRSISSSSSLSFTTF